MRRALAAWALLLISPHVASAEWQVKPFLGLVFGGGTTFFDPEQAAGTVNVVYGVTGQLLGDVLGIEADVGRAPGFFQSGEQRLVVESSVVTLTGNLVVALPRRMAQYTLRPYAVAGLGMMHVRIGGRAGAVDTSSVLPTLDVGGGATGFISDRIGLSWEIRRFQSLHGRGESGLVPVGKEQLSFWRVNMAVAIRY